jgi:cyanophycinase
MQLPAVKPKGTLLLIGGSEDKGENEPEIAYANKEFVRLEILKTFIKSIHKSNPRIEVITSASNIPKEMEAIYEDVFTRLGLPNVGFMHIRDRIQANEYEFIKKAESADAVLFSGGDQFRLSATMGSTQVLDVMKRKYFEEHFVIAGTSAGAMAAGNIMLYEGKVQEALIMGDVKTSSGLGFIQGCIIDTHFITRGRFGRLAQSIGVNPNCVGIGIGEDTSLLVREGNVMECFGSGMVIIIDGHEMKHTNITEATPGTPLYMENLKVHILAKGNGFMLSERQFLVSVSD